MTTSKTTGQLHFEDLDPKRFEDLVRQLIYDFRTWRRLEATGRGGGDDGFDARAYEITAPDLEPDDEGESTERIESTDPDLQDRLWLIQCKREQSIGPKKLRDYLGEINLSEGEVLHGLIFAAACDFSKRAHDEFMAACRSRGFQEWHLWGRGVLEDMLFLPKNDHLLFAYFGFSLTIRQRSVRTNLRATLATKKRLKTVTSKAGDGVVIIRNAFGDMYPTVPDPTGKSGNQRWRVCPVVKIGHYGFEISWAEFLAYLSPEDESWDAADVPQCRRSYNYHGTWDGDDGTEDGYNRAMELWSAFDEQNRAWITMTIAIPYDQVLAIDDAGDEFYNGPQVYCRYEGDLPSTLSYFSVESVDKFSGRRIFLEGPDDSRRIEKFPRALRWVDLEKAEPARR